MFGHIINGLARQASQEVSRKRKKPFPRLVSLMGVASGYPSPYYRLDQAETIFSENYISHLSPQLIATEMSVALRQMNERTTPPSPVTVLFQQLLKHLLGRR